MCIFMPCGFCMSARKELKMNKKEPVVLNSEVEMSKTLQIRNSTIDFLVFTKQNSQDSIEVRVQNENVWLTQDGISRLFDAMISVGYRVVQDKLFKSDFDKFLNEATAIEEKK